jgi:chromosome segregation ATPase
MPSHLSKHLQKTYTEKFEEVSELHEEFKRYITQLRKDLRKEKESRKRVLKACRTNGQLYDDLLVDYKKLQAQLERCHEVREANLNDCRELEAKVKKHEQWFNDNTAMLAVHRIGGYEFVNQEIQNEDST